MLPTNLRYSRKMEKKTKMESRFFSYKMMKKYVVAKTKYEQSGVSTKKSSRDNTGHFYGITQTEVEQFYMEKEAKKRKQEGAYFQKQ